MRQARSIAIRPAVWLGTALIAFAVVGAVGAQERPRAVHTIYLSALEVKGATTTDKLAAPPISPADLSKGYGFKSPGEADKSAPKKWEVASYVFNPSFVTVQQGDEIILTAFIVNGDEHEVWVTAPDGRYAVDKAIWNRGREYRIRFVADKPGAYQLVCSNHAPSMIATFLVLPR
jgi:plastocyanin